MVTEAGVCIAYDGTNARYADIVDEQVQNLHTVEVPVTSQQFFAQLGGLITDAASGGAKWGVVALPGNFDGQKMNIGPSNNLKALLGGAYNIGEEIRTAHPGSQTVLNAGFELIAVNSVDLAAQAAAITQAGPKDNRVAALHIEDGLSLGVVERALDSPDIFIADHRLPYEIGHFTVAVVDTMNPDFTKKVVTLEKTLSGPALARAHGAHDFQSMIERRRLSPQQGQDHPAAVKLGYGVVGVAKSLGPLYGIDVVVPTGLVGIGAADDYRQAFDRAHESYRQGMDDVQRRNDPRVELINSRDYDVFDLQGAPGVFRAKRYLDQKHAGQNVRVGLPLTQHRPSSIHEY